MLFILILYYINCINSTMPLETLLYNCKPTQDEIVDLMDFYAHVLYIVTSLFHSDDDQARTFLKKRELTDVYIT